MTKRRFNEGQQDLLVTITLKPHVELTDEQFDQLCADLWMIMKTSNGRTLLSPQSKGNSSEGITCVFEVSTAMRAVVEESLELSSIEKTSVVAITFDSIEPLNDPAHGIHISY